MASPPRAVAAIPLTFGVVSAFEGVRPHKSGANHKGTQKEPSRVSVLAENRTQAVRVTNKRSTTKLTTPPFIAR